MMVKLDIKTLAASAEIVASIAVVVSLLLVVASIDQNTKSLQSLNDNFLYELQSQRLRDVISDHEFASIVDRFVAGEDLTSVELRRYRYWQLQDINIWEIAFNRYNEGLLPEGQWTAWDRYFGDKLKTAYPEEWWAAIRHQYGDAFAGHLDAVYAGQ
jgi:hypothetical protein